MSLYLYDSPRGDARLPHLPLLRVPPKGEYRLAVTCWELSQVGTHFMGNRTLPCVRINCPGCERERPRRYEAYISGVRSTDHKHVLVAMTEGAAKDIYRGVSNSTQLRGHVITIKRRGSKPNGMLESIISEHMVDAAKLPAAPIILEHLAHIWGLNLSHIAQDHPEYAAEVRKMYSRGEVSDDAQPGPV